MELKAKNALGWLKNARFSETYQPGFWGAHLWRQVFGDENKLPITDYEDLELIKTDCGQWISLILLPSFRRGRRKHRVYVKCPGCSRLVPAGRVSQHVCRRK